MNSIFKKVFFIFIFVLVTLVLPAILLLLFVDVTTNLTTYFIVYALIIFGIFGYVVSCVREMNKKLSDALDEIKMQNAAIAFKLSNAGAEIIGTSPQTTSDDNRNTVESTVKVPLNPEEPLVVIKKVDNSEKKKSDDGFDDFK